MKQTYKAVILLVLFVLLILIGRKNAGGESLSAIITASTTPASNLTDRQEIWVNALEWCESQGDPTQINPKDRDNTPSYGILQFKPSTYKFYASIYKLASTTDYMNPVEQKQIVERMISDTTVNWHQQFPGCVQKLGMPPRK